MGERERMHLPIDFYSATLAMGHLALSLSPSTSYRISLQHDRRDIDGKRLTSSIGNAHHFGAYGIRYDALHRQFHNVISSVETDLCGEPMHNVSSTSVGNSELKHRRYFSIFHGPAYMGFTDER